VKKHCAGQLCLDNAFVLIEGHPQNRVAPAKVRPPAFHRTVKEEFYAVAFRKTFYDSLEQLQQDLDRYIAFYNRERAHQGYRTQGRTPYQTFLDGIAALRHQEVKPEAA
jgi:hypothetical protein